MPAILIRKLSEKAAQNIKQRAVANGRSAEAEARLVLEATFAAEPPFISAWDVIEEFKTANGGGYSLPSTVRSTEAVKPLKIE
jgi:hypothetical protein